MKQVLIEFVLDGIGSSPKCSEVWCAEDATALNSHVLKIFSLQCDMKPTVWQTLDNKFHILQAVVASQSNWFTPPRTLQDFRLDKWTLLAGLSFFSTPTRGEWLQK